MHDDAIVKSLVHRGLLDHEGHEGQAMFVDSLVFLSPVLVFVAVGKKRKSYIRTHLHRRVEAAVHTCFFSTANRPLPFQTFYSEVFGFSFSRA